MSDDPSQPRLGPHGGPRTKGARSPKIWPRGSRRDYILARLERDGRPALAEAIREGRVSAYTIAVELGWTKRAEPAGVSSSWPERGQAAAAPAPGPYRRRSQRRADDGTEIWPRRSRLVVQQFRGIETRMGSEPGRDHSRQQRWSQGAGVVVF